MPGRPLQEPPAFALHLSRPAFAAISLALTGWMGLGDYVTGANVAFTLLYLGPIALGTWTLGRRFGMFVSVLSALIGLFTEVLTRPERLPAAVVAWNVAVELGVFVVFTLLLGELHHRLQYEAQLARTDPLTGLSNSRAIEDALAAELERSRRKPGPLTVVYLDLDGLKAVNDRFGHEAGDGVLRAAADILRGGVRAIDTVARIGGDEFALLLPETALEPARTVCERLRRALAEAMRGRGWPVTASMGAATFTEPPVDAASALEHADRLMYRAKQSGRNATMHEQI